MRGTTGNRTQFLRITNKAFYHYNNAEVLGSKLWQVAVQVVLRYSNIVILGEEPTRVYHRLIQIGSLTWMTVTDAATETVQHV
jgi:hypothetical protein